MSRFVLVSVTSVSSDLDDDYDEYTHASSPRLSPIIIAPLPLTAASARTATQRARGRRGAAATDAADALRARSGPAPARADPADHMLALLPSICLYVGLSIARSCDRSRCVYRRVCFDL